MKYNHLIIVPCHSIWRGGNGLGEQASEWFLQEFQKTGNDHLCFVDHLLRGEQTLLEDAKSIMVISGGKTKEEAGQVSEAESYHKLLRCHWDRSRNNARKALDERIFIEPYARDSFENVIFLICKFHEVCRTYPVYVTISGFQFKQERFISLHLGRALKFDINKVKYLGNFPSPQLQGSERDAYYQEIEVSERRNALEPFEKDLYGIRLYLFKKRVSRNPFGETHCYVTNNETINRLLLMLNYCDETAAVRFQDEECLFPWNSGDAGF